MSDSDSAEGDVFDEARLSRLIALMKEHDLSEIDLRESRQRIRLKRKGMSGPAPTGYAPYMPPAYAVPQYAPAPPATPASQSAAAPATPSGDGDNILIIKSPMVGTFYSRPNPNSPPFVKVGDQVDPEKTICIIEAMKVFNEIPAEVHGKIVAVLARDEEAVDFGKPLFKVDKNG
jgi:acetyl-CoA carboxylase biotin carboxyl carrier protein